MSIGERILEIRKTKAISREQLASRAEMSYSQLQRIEQGKHEPRVSTQHMIARALGVPVAELRSDEPVTGTKTTNERLDDIERRLGAIESRLDALPAGADKETITAALADMLANANS